MKSKRILQILALVIALSMIFTTAAFAVPGHKNFEKNFKSLKLNDEDYNRALMSLISKEIVKGYGKGEYGLRGNVKRGDVIVMIIRALELEDNYDFRELGANYLSMLKDIDDFEDVKDINAYYYGPIKIAKKLGIARGDGIYFKPNTPVTIQEAIWLISRAEALLDKNIDMDSDRIEELKEIYADELNDFAKRQDVFWMLNYVLDLEEIEEDFNLKNINIDLEDESQLNFEDDWFEDAYTGDSSDLKYIKFTLPDGGGKLYYNYDKDENKNSLVSEKIKYYFDDEEDTEIENISFVPDDNYKGNVTIEYSAYTDEESYSGLIKITVDYNTPDIITYNVKENKYVNFDEEDFDKNIDEVTFELPDEKTGTLYYDDDEDGRPESDEVISKKTVFDRDQLDNIIFKTYQYFKGEAAVKYTADEHINNEVDKTYYGEIKIIVEGVQDIASIKLDCDFDDGWVNIDLNNNLEDITEDDDPFDLDDVDYVKLEQPKDGTLKIKLKDKSLINADYEDSYELKEIEYIRYIFEDNGEIEINYKVYDEKVNSVLEYDGIIIIDIDN